MVFPEQAAGLLSLGVDSGARSSARWLAHPTLNPTLKKRFAVEPPPFHDGDAKTLCTDFSCCVETG